MSVTTPCVEYDGFRTARGYGRINKRVAGRLVSRYVHRVAWEDAHGPIPSDMVVMHLCDNPACYRLDHLRLGSQAENMRDMKAKGRQRNRNGRQLVKPGRLADRGHCKNGHAFTDENTYRDPRGWRSCRICRSESDRRGRERRLSDVAC